MKKILVIIDFQNDFCNMEIGSIPSQHASDACDRFVQYLKEHYKEYDRIFYTLDTHYVQTYMDSVEGKKLPILHCVRGTIGHELRPDLKDIITQIKTSGAEVHEVEKNTFGRTDWNNILGVGSERDTQIDIVGCATDICVLSNATIIKAYYPNAQINLLEQYCGGITEEDHVRAIEALKRIHIDVI